MSKRITLALSLGLGLALGLLWLLGSQGRRRRTHGSAGDRPQGSSTVGLAETVGRQEPCLS